MVCGYTTQVLESDRPELKFSLMTGLVDKLLATLSFGVFVVFFW